MRSAYRLAFFPFLCHSMNFRSSFHILFECECDCGITRCWGFFGFLSGWIETTTRQQKKTALYTWCSINKRFSLCNKRKLQNRIKSNKNITPKSTNVKWKKKWMWRKNANEKEKNGTEKNCRRNTSNYTQNEENHSKWKDFINSIFVKRKKKNAAGKNNKKKRQKKHINHPNKYTLIGLKSTKKLRTWIPCKQHAFENWFIRIVCIVIWVFEWLQRFRSILLAFHTFAFQFQAKTFLYFDFRRFSALRI